MDKEQGPIVASTDVSREPLMLQFVSAISGNVYDETTVDHVADMALIFYSAGGASVGAMIGACFGAWIAPYLTSSIQVFSTIALFCLIGAFLGALLVLYVLNLRGLVKWENGALQRSYKAKS